MSRRRRRRGTANRNTMPVNDAFSNPAARIGFGTMDLINGTAYPMTRLSQDYQKLTSLYRDNWIIQNIIQLVPDDVTRKWYTVKTAIAPEYIDRFTRAERQSGLRKSIKEGMYWGRLYGGAAGIIMIKGDDDLSEPLDINRIMPDSFEKLLILDRWTGIYPGASLVTDPGDPDYGLPEYYTIIDQERGATVANVHHSRVIRFVGRELPWLEKVVEQYWGESEVESIYQDLIRHDNVAANMAALTFRANVNYMESDGLDQLLGTGNAEMQRRFWNVMQAQSIMESNFGTRVINKGDAIHNTQYTFTGLADVYECMMMDVAGAARIPVTKLFGRSPAGMNSTGESDMRNYYDYIDSIRDTTFRAIIERLLPVLAMSAWGKIPDDLDIDFEPMQTPNNIEIADITAKKTAAIVQAYQADLIDLETARKELNALDAETGMFGNLPDDLITSGRGVTYSQSMQMRDPMAGIFAEPVPEDEPEPVAPGGDVE